MLIGPGDLNDPEVVAFLEAHVEQLRSMGPPESTHVLDLSGLRAPGIGFHTAYDAGELVGCAALKDLGEGDAELKSMRTAPHRTRQGIARRLLVHVLEEARSSGFTRVSLETGSYEFFHPAHALYRRHGFVECEPFGGYRPDPLSVFMTLEL
ncbi:MAG: GNAT family N-acetyltransferase [Nocardioides sp.]|uniref:GNAT family N-acetyltransferase n=1 Tax=Nocardioides sp. TaxID=35761 RepID=UPI00238C6CA1|nr:GNAT family N-acetyltransferase [Nocardioides sp.]MDE0776538.1 GNAT family N-acetyltransferase [Nocardioides sp.]